MKIEMFFFFGGALSASRRARQQPQLRLTSRPPRPAARRDQLPALQPPSALLRVVPLPGRAPPWGEILPVAPCLCPATMLPRRLPRLLPLRLGLATRRRTHACGAPTCLIPRGCVPLVPRRRVAQGSRRGSGTMLALSLLAFGIGTRKGCRGSRRRRMCRNCGTLARVLRLGAFTTSTPFTASCGLRVEPLCLVFFQSASRD